MKAIHVVMLVSLALASSLPGMTPALPPAAAPWLKGLAAALNLVGAVLAAISPPVNGYGRPKLPMAPPSTPGVNNV